MRLPAVVPELIVAAACLLLVALAGWVRGRWRVAPAAATAAVLAAALAVTAASLGAAPVPAFEGTYLVDAQAQRFKLLILTAALIALALSACHFRGRAAEAHAPAALLFATLGALGLCSAVDLGLVLLFLQITSMASYVLVALVRSDTHALEAALKYFLFGAAALAVMAYGLTFLYGLTGSLDLRTIGVRLAEADRGWVAVALVLALAGYGFKAALVPVHFWAPDALGTAAAPVAGFLSVVPKLGAFAALARFVVEALPPAAVDWPWLLALLAAATMSYGNLAALRQQRLKRLLAYSTIAQAGYLLTAVTVLTRAGGADDALLFYLAAYLLMNLAAFAVAGSLELEGDRAAALRGLSRRTPPLAAALAVALLSLAGIPPLAGFAGKVLLLEAALDGGMAWLAIVAALNMLLALVYYLRLVAWMYFQAPDTTIAAPRAIAGFAAAGLWVCVGGTLLLGLLPGVWLPSG